MTEQTNYSTGSASGGWTSTRPPEQPRPLGPPVRNSGLTRFLGGSPAAVALRLVLLSLIVGALLMWLEIRPEDIILGVERFFRRLWLLGFDAIRDAAQYIVAGALIVVPVWFVLRLMNMRGAR